MSPLRGTEMEKCDLVVVGAGTAALHLLSRLPDRLLNGTVVVDGSDQGWLARWTQRCASLDSPHMRTPVMQHPHAQPLALHAYAERRGRLEELTPVAKGFAPVPSLPLFLDFCRAKVVAKLPPALKEPQRDSVVRLEPLKGEEGPGCRVHLASGRVLTARAVVYTPANCRPVVPAWVGLLLRDGSEARCTAGAADAGVLEPRLHPAAAARLPPGIATSDQVDLRCAQLAGRRVVVVGGGMTAGLLAAGAAERGAAEVTLVCRRPLVFQPFETEVGWWGAKQLNQYRQQDSPVQRLSACRRARKQGTVHLPVWRRLAHQAAAGRLTVLEGWEVTTAAQATQDQQQQGAPDNSSGGTCWWLSATPRQANPSVAFKLAGTPTLFQRAVAAAQAAGGKGSEAGGGALHAAAPTAQLAQQAALTAQQRAQQGQRSLECDLVWLACGQAYDAAYDPVLRRLQQRRPTLLVGGYPVLDDEHLCWPGAGVYLLGRASRLSVGPCSGDLPGMRLAADRIAASLQRLDYSDAPVWEGAQGRLVHRLRRLGQHPSTDAAGGSDDDVVDAEQVAAAVAAAAGALPAVPLEAEGAMFEDPRPKKSVAKPDNLIDVTDLDPALPRKELAQYKFADDDFEICVICQLEEAVPLDQVRVLFGAQHLEMWAVGAQAAYHLHLPRLYGRVITKKCSVKVNQKAHKVYLLLQKESDAEWRFLKG